MHPSQWQIVSRSVTRVALISMTMLMVGLVAAPPDATAAANGNGPPTSFVYIGTWHPPSARTTGIYVTRLDQRSGHLSPPSLAVELSGADWLVVHPHLPILYSVASLGRATAFRAQVYGFRVDRTGSLSRINDVDTGGRDACNMVFDAPSSTLLVANHGSGTVSALPVQRGGSLEVPAAIAADYGTGPAPRQQRGPAAHGVAVDPTHRYVLVADFSADRVFIYRFNGKNRKLSRSRPQFVSLPAGSGPRHLVFAPHTPFLFLNTELSAQLRSYRWEPRQGRLQLIQAVSAFPATDTGERSSAELAVSADGRFVYLSLRGDQNAIVAYAIDQRRGTFREIQRISSQGKVPWAFGIDPTGRWMLIANEGSNTVDVLRIDRSTGRLTAIGESIPIPQPAAVAFYPG